MTIIMTMNIYITPQNEEKLRQEPSMSGLINSLLMQHYAKYTDEELAEMREMTQELVDYHNQKVASDAFAGRLDESNPYQCKKCGMMKVAGKCVTKGCKG